MPRRRHLAATALACLALSGCATGFSDREVARTGAALGRVQTTFEDYYRGLNAYGRETYIRAQVYRGLPVDGGNPRLKGSIYPDEAIQARLAALEVLGRYAALLDAYANGTEAKDFGAAVGGFSDSLFGLQSNLAAAGGDASLEAYRGPVTALVSSVAEWILDAKLRKAFKTHVAETTPKVRAVLALLQADARNVLSPTRLIGAHQEFATLVTYYNERAGTLTLAERAAITDALINAAEARDASDRIDLVGLVASADRAIVALDKKVQSGAATPAETRAAIDEFAARVRALNDILDKLKAARKG